MTYRISPLEKEQFQPLFEMDEEQLAAIGAVRMQAKADAGYPCRISLRDAAKGESLILLNHVSHDVATPYRSAFAIFLREDAEQAAPLVDTLPPVFEGRPISLRGFDARGMMCQAQLALPGEADTKILALFANPDVAYIHAHNAARGCFAARIDRTGEDE
ncbi:DUF1203 domain-containing protein [Allopontixanthobacter sediminis]|uniref:DUF1203 domain-containing protein n=1 Tax=Allopontixanthobacter sediminis TaxID=1689985 RepID=A0A845AY50_9SPHN|nr:DUF1203 domain-containing protein [Allopontixanthobacter sediminis]MXP43175.1 DUF1203 domain-containing protein [Allopontixanthobacter sediminis]